MNTIRWKNFVILMILTGVAMYFGVWIARSVFSLLEFQLVVYSRILEGQASIHSVKEGVANTRDSISSLRSSKEVLVSVEEGVVTSNAEKLLQFRRKLFRIAGSIGTIFGLLAWKVLFDLFYFLDGYGKRLHSYLIKQESTNQ